MGLPVIKSELYTSVILASIVTVLVWLNTPTLTVDQAKQQGQSVFTRTMTLLLRTFLIAFVTIYAIYYFSNNDSNKSEDVIQNIIKTEPDF